MAHPCSEPACSGASRAPSRAKASLKCSSAERPPDRIGYVASDRFAGQLGERRGSLVFQHGGPIDRGALQSFGYIVPGSGTGELRGLRGEVTIAVTAAGEHTLTLDYDFEE